MVDKQKEWKKNGDKKSISDYNKWKNTNYKIKYGLIKDEKLLSDIQKKNKKISNDWYLKNRERILKEYHKLKPYIWIQVNIEDRDFVLNFNPKEYPKYLESLEKIKNSLI
tara:strand:+ start:1306 stop:1635 length:330 start_codon:yes stop_codon:yes gene_type:complete